MTRRFRGFGAPPPQAPPTGFYPPLPSPGWFRFAQWLLPWLKRGPLEGLSVTFSPGSLDTLRQFQGERRLLLPNHPTQWDPWVMGSLSMALEEPFFYVAARELFDFCGKLLSRVLQGLGVYSVVRGASDHDSFQTTIDILSENRGPLVIFVEGETSNQNDSLLPLEPGVLHLAFMALLAHEKTHTAETPVHTPALYVCPVAIKYFFEPQGLEKKLGQTLCKLEEATGLHPATGSLFQRITHLGQVVLMETAQQFGVALPEAATLEARLRALEEAILSKMETMLSLPPPGALTYLDRVRRIRNATDRVLKTPPESDSPYHQRLHRHQAGMLEHFYWDLDRVVNVVGIYDGYVRPKMSNERTVEVVRRLEREILGYYHFQHPRTAVVTVAPPIDLRPHLAAYGEDKRQTTATLLLEIEKALYTGITTAQPPETYCLAPPS